jgi:RHS repeat-associated protein
VVLDAADYRHELGADGGHSSSVTDPDTGTSTTVVDNDGNTVKTTDGRGQVLTTTYDVLGRRKAEYNGTTQSAATQLASWTYDSAPGGKDQPASSTRLQTIGSNTYAYVQSVDGYTAAGSPTGVKVTIPVIGNTAQDKLAGSYDTTYGYTPVTGLLDHTNYPAAGGLPAESVFYSYTTSGLLTTVAGNNDYTTFVQYSPTGQVQRTTLGDTPKQAVQTYTYDTSTGRIIGINDNVQNLTPSADAITYTYNPAGDLTSAKDVQNAASTDLQCYQYDGYQRLTGVWTDPGTQTSTQGTNTVDGIGGCTATGPTEGNQGTGPAPYWQTYTYDNTGNKQAEVDHDTSGPTTRDITRTSSYTNPGQSSWPVHGLASVTSTGPAGTGQNTYRYDAAGNMTTRVLSTGDSETMRWDPEGRLSQDTTTGGTVSYLYDASGSTLLRQDTGRQQTTLYLPGQEVYLNTTTQVLTASRFMPAPGGATVVEQSNNAIWYAFTDPQGTATLDVNASTLALSRREFTPWGAPRGTAAASWPDDHTFLGKATDATTGLVDLGARQYDPSTGRFISVDPVLESSDPRQMGGYTRRRRDLAAARHDHPAHHHQGRHLDHPGRHRVHRWRVHLADQVNGRRRLVRMPDRDLRRAGPQNRDRVHDHLVRDRDRHQYNECAGPERDYHDRPRAFSRAHRHRRQRDRHHGAVRQPRAHQRRVELQPHDLASAQRRVHLFHLQNRGARGDHPDAQRRIRVLGFHRDLRRAAAPAPDPDSGDDSHVLRHPRLGDQDQRELLGHHLEPERVAGHCRRQSGPPADPHLVRRPGPRGGGAQQGQRVQPHRRHRHRHAVHR